MKNTRIPALLPLCLAAMVSREALALGLGSAELASRLGSPLQARIPLRSMDGLDPEQLLISIQPVWDEDSESVIGGLKPGDIQVTAYRDEQGQALIDLSSAEPIAEPFLNFVVSVRWPQGSLNREYTLLLDLPTTSVASPQSPLTASQADVPVALPTTPTQTYSSSSITPRTGASISSSSTHYVTQRGDSLWSIAARLRRERGGDQQRVMEQIYALNPEAFIRKARHLLKESVTLDIDPARLSSVLSSATALPSAALPPRDLPPSGGAGEALAVEAAQTSDSETEAAAIESVPQATSGEGGRAAELTESLLAVSQEVEQVTQNIEVMSARLAQLQARLAGLQQEYAQVQGEVNALRNDGLVDRLTEDGVRGEPVLATADERDAAAASLEAEGIAAQDQLATVINASQSEISDEPVVEPESVMSEAVQSDSATARLWWLWALAALAALWVVLRRRGRKAPVASYQAAPIVTGKPPEPSPQHSPDAFHDVFDDLDGRRTRGSQDTAAVAEATEPTQSDVDDELSAMPEDDISVENTLPPVGAAAVSVSPGSDAETAAAACLSLNDLPGARRILEAELHSNDVESLKLMLLDVYAQQGDVSEFETLALQMEFAGVSDELIREMDVLRKAMAQRVDQLGQAKG